MVQTMTIKNKVLETLAFKEKEPYKTKLAQDWKEEENLQKKIETTIKEMQDKEPLLSLPCFLIKTIISRIGMEPTNLSKLIRSTKVDSLIKTLKDQLLESKHSITLE